MTTDAEAAEHAGHEPAAGFRAAFTGPGVRVLLEQHKHADDIERRWVELAQWRRHGPSFAHRSREEAA